MTTPLVREAAPVSLMTQSRYTIRRPFWSFFERTFRVFSGDGQLIMLVRHPLLRLREGFTVFADEAKTRPILNIQSKQIVAINFEYVITDATNGQMLGTVQKRGLKSILRDKFLIFDHNHQEIGFTEEQGAAILRRFLPILTSHHQVQIHGQVAADIKQRFRFFTKEFDVDVNPSVADPRFVMACALLALMAEAHREDR